MESQPQNPEFMINPGNFHLCINKAAKEPGSGVINIFFHAQLK